MPDTAIKVENLSKQYRIGVRQQGYKTIREAIVDSATAPFRLARSLFSAPSSLLSSAPKETIWALKDVSFEINQGEVVGIIGRNGAGKSTLLKVLAKITEPTQGRVELKGRVGSLLEVGTGFHPELTGHENIYLYGSILGMDRYEVTRKFDEIVGFAELERFIDTPVKRYSSGMYMRLAFAVAAHLEPEILLIDEVLAVGDIEFQKKCIGKMDAISNAGRTVLFVSHNVASVRHLCNRGILIEGGKIVLDDEVDTCIARYTSRGTDSSRSIIDHIAGAHQAVQVNSIRINGIENDRVEILSKNHEMEILIEGEVKKDLRLDLEARIVDLYDTPLAFYSPGHYRGHAPLIKKGKFILKRRFCLPDVARGEYFVTLELTNPGVICWVGIPHAVRLIAEGAATETGLVFDYNSGVGWTILDDSHDY